MCTWITCGRGTWQVWLPFRRRYKFRAHSTIPLTDTVSSKMRLKVFTLVATSFAFLAPVLGAPPTALADIQKFDGQVKEGSYIVKLKDNASKSGHLSWLGKQLGSDSLTHTEWQKGLLHGFAGEPPVSATILFNTPDCTITLGKFSEKTLTLLRSNPDVEYIAEDGIVTTFSVVTQ